MIIYLHGFASSGNSNKATMLRERFGASNVATPDLPFDPKQVYSMVHKIVVDSVKTIDTFSSPIVFIGTSLGAFYANYFSHLYDCHAILVNPSVTPSETLKNRLGPNKNYATGEEFFVSLAHLTELEEMKKYIKDNYIGGLINLFLAKDDDVIPYEAALEAFKFPKSVYVSENGGHRFDMHWNKVLDKAEELLNVSVI